MKNLKKVGIVLFAVVLFTLLTMIIPNNSLAATNKMPEAVNGVITLTEDVELTSSYEVKNGTTVIIDLNGYKIVNTSAFHTIVVEKGGNLTIRGEGTVDNISHGKGAVVNHGTFTLEGGTLTRSAETGVNNKVSGGNSWYVVDNNGQGAVMTVKGGEIISTGGYSSLIRNLGATINVEGGTLRNGFIALKNDDNGVANVTGGTIETTSKGGSNGGAIQNWGEIDITGGKILAPENMVAVYTSVWSDSYNTPITTINGDVTIEGEIYLERDRNYQCNNIAEVVIENANINGDIVVRDDSKVSINGGIVSGTITTNSENAVIRVSGGTFSQEVPDEYLTEDNKVEYTPADYSALLEVVDKANALDKNKYTQESYQKLQDALAAIEYGLDFRYEEKVNQMTASVENAMDGLVLADTGDVDENTINNIVDDGEKDDTPKTGNLGIYFILPLVVISIICVVVFNKRK